MWAQHLISFQRPFFAPRFKKPSLCVVLCCYFMMMVFCDLTTFLFHSIVDRKEGEAYLCMPSCTSKTFSVGGMHHFTLKCVCVCVCECVCVCVSGHYYTRTFIQLRSPKQFSLFLTYTLSNLLKIFFAVFMEQNLEIVFLCIVSIFVYFLSR